VNKESAEYRIGKMVGENEGYVSGYRDGFNACAAELSKIVADASAKYTPRR
jgi:hypothetical protein